MKTVQWSGKVATENRGRDQKSYYAAIEINEKLLRQKKGFKEGFYVGTPFSGRDIKRRHYWSQWKMDVATRKEC